MLLITTLLLTLLTGCSSKQDVTKDITVGWESGVIKFGDEATDLDSYTGYEAIITEGKGGLTYNFMLDNAKDVTNISINTQGILEEDMDEYKGKFYYTEYLGSKLTMAKRLEGDDWIVCQVITDGQAPTAVAAYASEYIDQMRMTNAQVYVDFGSFKFGTPYDVVTVRQDCALITGIAKVSQGTFECNTPVTIVQSDKEYQLMKGSSAKYDYYTYDGYLIQVAAGLDVGTYITFD